MATGLRVIRGPDWSAGNKDGGDGHVGTVVSYGKDKTAEIIWDNGYQTISSIGKDNTFELRVLDNAPAGIQHTNIICNSCHEDGVFGMRWSCTLCNDYNLCSQCYVTGKHDITHEFNRYDTPKSNAVKVSARNKSKKVNALGIFPEAHVVRGTHWEQNELDGGPGMPGVVESLITPDSKSPRSAVTVRWQTGTTNVCRVGYQGKVDIQYTDEAPGVDYYPEHLPVLDAVCGMAPVDLIPTESQFSIGDNVIIHLDKLSLKKVMESGSGWSAGMAKCIGEIGVIKSFTSNGDADVEFRKNKYRLPPKVLKQIINPEPGSAVRIIDDINMAKMFQEHHGGWVDRMTKFLGKVGLVKKIDSDGDVIVIFGKRRWSFSPACCMPASKSELSSDPDSESEMDISDLAEHLAKTLGRHQGKTSTKVLTIDGDGFFSQFVKATVEGDLAKVKTVVAKYPKIITEKEQGFTCLHIAANEVDLAIAKFLVENHANINATDKDGDTPLMIAVGDKNTEVAEYLLDAGAQTDIMNDKRHTAMHKAVIKGHTAFIHRLILKGCDVNIRDILGNTPLHVAILQDETEAAEIILTAKTLDLTIVNKKGFNPIQWAGGHGSAQIALKILQRNKSIVDSKKDDGFTALHLAAINNNADVAKVLLSQGASVNSTNLKRATPLHLACSECYLELVQVLVSEGADVNACDRDNDTPLHLVMMQDKAGDLLTELMSNRKKNDKTKAQIVTYLLEHGANTEAKNDKRKTPIDICKSQTIKDAVENFRQLRAPTDATTSSVSPSSAGAVLCSECLNKMANSIFLPCTHKILCSDCCQNVKVCSLCNKDVNKIIEEDTVSAKPPVDPTPGDSQFNIGDMVVIDQDTLSLKKVMDGESVWSPDMAKCIGEIGVIKSFASNGDADVEFKNHKYGLPPKVLRKIINPEPGSAVRIIDDMSMAKMFQEHHGGWVDRMAKFLGKVGRVKEIAGDGNVIVLFGKRRSMFCPPCCIPASESDLPSDSDSEGGSSGLQEDLLHTLLDAVVGVFPQVVIATHGGDLAKVKKLVAKRPQVTKEKEQSLTLLHIAAHEGELAIVKFLVESHADINATDSDGDTPLMVAVGKKETEIAEFLVGAGTQTDTINDKGRSPLHNAAYTGQATLVQALVLKDCDVNLRDKDGDTPLHDAIAKDETEAAERILTAKTLDLTIVNKRGFNPIHWTGLHGRAQIARKILQKNTNIVDSKKDDGFTTLHLTAINNHADVAKVLLSQGASVNSTNDNGATPLHLACMQDYLELVQVLVSKGANVNACDCENNTPLHLVMMQDKRFDLLRNLMGEGTKNDGTRAQIVTYLLEHGANKDAKNDKRKTPIDICESQTIKDAVRNFSQTR